MFKVDVYNVSPIYNQTPKSDQAGEFVYISFRVLVHVLLFNVVAPMCVLTICNFLINVNLQYVNSTSTVCRDSRN